MYSNISEARTKSEVIVIDPSPTSSSKSMVAATTFSEAAQKKTAWEAACASNGKQFLVQSLPSYIKGKGHSKKNDAEVVNLIIIHSKLSDKKN